MKLGDYFKSSKREYIMNIAFLVFFILGSIVASIGGLYLSLRVATIVLLIWTLAWRGNK